MARSLCSFGTRGALAGGLLAAFLMLVPGPARADPMAEGLERLSEILGAAHHLRAICGANEGALWRNKMIDLLDAANQDALQRQVLISHFNSAYHEAQEKFPRCTEAAATESRTIFDEGRALAARLSGPDRSARAF